MNMGIWEQLKGNGHSCKGFDSPRLHHFSGYYGRFLERLSRVIQLRVSWDDLEGVIFRVVYHSFIMSTTSPIVARFVYIAFAVGSDLIGQSLTLMVRLSLWEISHLNQSDCPMPGSILECPCAWQV